METETNRMTEESPRVRKWQQKKRDCSLLETAAGSHEEAAPVLPCRGTIVRSGLVSPGGHLPRAEHHRRDAWAVLTQRVGQRTPWGGDWCEGVLSRVSTSPQSEVGAEERCRKRVIRVQCIKRGCSKGLRGTGDWRWLVSIQTEGIFPNHRISQQSIVSLWAVCNCAIMLHNQCYW